MKREGIEKYIEKKQKLSDRNYENYQASGEPKYMRAYERYEDEIQIARQALTAADDHTKALEYKSELVSLASRADKAISTMDPSELLAVCRDVLACGKIAGYLSRWEEEHGR